MTEFGMVIKVSVLQGKVVLLKAAKPALQEILLIVT